MRYIKGVGEAREKLFHKLNIRTMRDLVGYFPRAYEDRTRFRMIHELEMDEVVCVRAMVTTAPRLSHIRRGLDIVKLRAVDDTGEIDITFFNQSFVKDAIKWGETYIFYGKVSATSKMFSMTNPIFERDTQNGEFTGRIIPVYPLTKGLTQKSLMNAVRHALKECGDELPDALPKSVTERYELCKVPFAYENIHFPRDANSLEIARKRLVFEELFVLAAAMKFLRLGRENKAGRSLTTPDFAEFYNALPFEATNAQKRAINESARDMAGEIPMNRLIQGDVGSGKTLVAAALSWAAAKCGRQTAFMAPTEILAQQHYRSMSELLEPLGIRVGLLTGSLTAKQKRDVYGQLNLGEIDLIIGTHALISDGVSFHDLALVITDEQHRFGVNQRSTLIEKGESPHVLVMSATPIPRTLSMIIYGDLDVSVIDEMPPGRREVETFVVTERHRKRIYSFSEKLVGEGRQIYVICPMVEEGEEMASAVSHYETLKKDVFPNLRVALVHGKMNSKDKDASMKAFADGEADILVATTVVEVGVDVPNAALIIVENADRFGLSQLHQLRGRVGRGKHESYCVLFGGTAAETSRARLEILRTTNDGFKIAEEDLKLRGPGDFFGSRQHGLPQMRIADLSSDMETLYLAQNAAADVMKDDPTLSLPENKKLAQQMARMFESSNFPA